MLLTRNVRKTGEKQEISCVYDKLTISQIRKAHKRSMLMMMRMKLLAGWLTKGTVKHRAKYLIYINYCNVAIASIHPSL